MPARPELDPAARAANPAHQHLVRVPDPPESGCLECGCMIALPLECNECRGDDDTGEAFCPVCEYCCGC